MSFCSLAISISCCNLVTSLSCAWKDKTIFFIYLHCAVLVTCCPLGTGYTFSRAGRHSHIFPRLSKVTCFPRLGDGWLLAGEYWLVNWFNWVCCDWTNRDCGSYWRVWESQAEQIKTYLSCTGYRLHKPLTPLFCVVFFCLTFYQFLLKTATRILIHELRFCGSTLCNHLRMNFPRLGKLGVGGLTSLLFEKAIGLLKY